jgi:hypothetical protein
MNLFIEPDSILEIRKGRFRWVGHVERMSEERSANNVVKNKSEGKTSVGKQRK